MKRVLRWMLWLAIGALLLLIALFAVSRLRGPSVDQREAQALMEPRASKPPGRNAYAAVWLLGYDIPSAEIEAVMAQDVRKFARESPEEFYVTDFKSVAAGRYAFDTLTDAEHALLCRPRERDCIAQVLADAEAQRAMVARHAKLIARFRALEQYGHSRSPMPVDALLSPVVPYNKVSALAGTQDILNFAAGDTERALDGLCRSVLAGRGRLRHSEALLDALVLAKSVDDMAGTFGQMLARLPASYPIPLVCQRAFAPPAAAELLLCEPMRGEYAMHRVSLRKMRDEDLLGGRWPAALSPLLFDEANTLAQMAEKFRPACAEATARQVAQDQPARWADPPQSPWRLECLGNWAGCRGMAVSGALSADYQHALQDHGARLRLLSAALWLRAQPVDPRPLVERLQSAPAEMGNVRRPLEIADGVVRLPMYRRYEDDATDGAFEVPVAAFNGAGADAAGSGS